MLCGSSVCAPRLPRTIAGRVPVRVRVSGELTLQIRKQSDPGVCGQPQQGRNGQNDCKRTYWSDPVALSGEGAVMTGNLWYESGLWERKQPQFKWAVRKTSSGR